MLKLLSQFQRFHTKTEEKASSIVKMFLIQLINTGLVILLVNARITEIRLPEFIPLFQGKYQDFTVEWYRVVGSTISFTMLINIITPHTGAIIGMLMGGLFKCMDRGCSCDKRRTKKRLQEDYENTYMGPEFLIEIRYSQILASFYIMMIYSSGMPLLYPIGMLQYFFTYWVDKFLFLRLYKTPPRYGIEMSEVTRKTMVVAVFLHWLFAFYMYSNSQIFTYSSSIEYIDYLRGQVQSNVGSYIDEATAGAYITVTRVLQPHALIYLIAFAVFIIVNVLAQVFLTLCKDSCAGFCCCCFTGKSRSKALYTYSNNIYEDLSIEDLRTEYAKSKTELNDCRLMVT